MLLRFADCELDLGRVVLRRAGHDVRIEPQAFDLLAYLVEHRGAVVRKEQLLDDIWGDRFVSESALTTRIKAVRQAVGDDGNRQAIIRTVHGKGYEFVAAVDSAPGTGGGAEASAPGITPLEIALQPLIGREAELDQLVATLASHRLVTLVGPGGVGKTALGFELARSAAAAYADGVHVVELVRVVDEDATADAFATAIDVNLRRRSSIDDAIVEMLRPRHSLLLLDNCEHLVEPVAALVNRILRETPSVSIVATSREPLAVPGEQLWSVAPLLTTAATDVADELTEIPAVALFAARATASDPSFAIDETTAPMIVEICRRLDGIPLAIELAAARARSLGVAEIARRLDERFGLLKAMRRGTDPRHRTMHDAISWSYEMLEPDEQALFIALSVFAGSFDFDAADAMCPGGDVIDLLTRLTERSMLTVRPQLGGATRYELLETLREYGRTRLGDDRALPRFTAHAEYFSAEAGKVEAGLRGPDEGAAMARAESSFADLRSAQRFALEVGSLDAAFGLIASIREFAMRAMRYEVFAWADAACRTAGATDHSLVPVLTGMRAYGAWVRGEFDAAVSLAEETRRLETVLGTPPCGLTERVLGNVLYIVDEADLGNAEAGAAARAGRGLGQRVASRPCVLHAQRSRSARRASTTRPESSSGAPTSTRRRTGCPTDLASAEIASGFASSSETDALEAFISADRIARAAGNRWMSAFAHTEASGLLVAHGDLDGGCAGLADMITLWYRAGDWSQQWHTLSRCMIALHRIGEDELAMELVGAIEAHTTLGVAPMTAILRDVAFDTREVLIEELGDPRAEELCAAGTRAPIEDIVLRTRRALVAPF